MVAPRTDDAQRAGRLLLELDPDLGQLLTDERRVDAERELRVASRSPHSMRFRLQKRF